MCDETIQVGGAGIVQNYSMGQCMNYHQQQYTTDNYKQMEYVYRLPENLRSLYELDIRAVKERSYELQNIWRLEFEKYKTINEEEYKLRTKDATIIAAEGVIAVTESWKEFMEPVKLDMELPARVWHPVRGPITKRRREPSPEV